MPKKRQIPRLFERRHVDGTIAYSWKPSKTLRSAGYVNMPLGTDEVAAVSQAIELNKQVAAIKAGTAETAQNAPTLIRPAPRVVRFAELVRRYQQHDAWLTLKKSTKGEYGTRLRQLEHWALDGELAVRSIDVTMVRDLRNGLMGGSVWRAASTLRVLRLLLGWAEAEGIIKRGSNPATDCDIPEPPSRKTRMDAPVRDAIVEAAMELPDRDFVALAVDLAFWLLQRQGDILQLNRMGWREVGAIDSRHAAQLADARGRVMAFRLCQQKTGTWIDAPVPPMLHDRVNAAMRASNSGYIFPYPGNPNQAMPSWMFQRRFREVQDAAMAVAIMRGDMKLAEQIDACQFRDLRRTGMIFYKSMGVKVPDITALSGHFVVGKKTILDTYMPGDTEGACACVATGLAGWQARKLREQQA